MTRHTIVIVEDEPVQRMNAVAAFAGGGFETADFDNAEEAAQFIQINDAAVLAVFTDVQMTGDMDGINLAAQIAVNYPGIAMLVTSGQPERVLERLPPNGYFVPKPWLAADLVEAVQEISHRQTEPA